MRTRASTLGMSDWQPLCLSFTPRLSGLHGVLDHAAETSLLREAVKPPGEAGTPLGSGVRGPRDQENPSTAPSQHSIRSRAAPTPGRVC
jgi:hypothetical protein